MKKKTMRLQLVMRLLIAIAVLLNVVAYWLLYRMSEVTQGNERLSLGNYLGTVVSAIVTYGLFILYPQDFYSQETETERICLLATCGWLVIYCIFMHTSFSGRIDLVILYSSTIFVMRMVSGRARYPAY